MNTSESPRVDRLCLRGVGIPKNAWRSGSDAKSEAREQEALCAKRRNQSPSLPTDKLRRLGIIDYLRGKRLTANLCHKSFNQD